MFKVIRRYMPELVITAAILLSILAIIVAYQLFWG